jgi:hypothetical protein
MKGRDFIAFASKVAALHHEEPARRSAISRAYYGGLHATFEFLRSLTIPTDTRHDNAAIDLKSSLLTDSMVAGRMLDRLRELRIKADYRLTDASGCSADLVTNSVETASRLAQLLEVLHQQMLEQPAMRAQFIAEVRAARSKSGRRT